MMHDNINEKKSMQGSKSSANLMEDTDNLLGEKNDVNSCNNMKKTLKINM